MNVERHAYAFIIYTYEAPFGAYGEQSLILLLSGNDGFAVTYILANLGY